MNPALFVLHVEDDPNDVLLFSLALQKRSADVLVQTVTDGVEALSYLQGSGLFADRSRFPLPGLLILDLKLPGLGGFDVLEWMRRQMSYELVHVFVLSSSFHPQDMSRARELGAERYFVKRHDFADIVNAVLDLSRGRNAPGCTGANPH